MQNKTTARIDSTVNRINRVVDDLPEDPTRSFAAKSVFDKALSEPGQLLWDEDESLIVLVDEHGAILAAMRYDMIDGSHARVSLVASNQGRRGLGYRVYLGAMAALHPTTLSPDDCSVSGHSISIWDNIAKDPGVTQERLLGTLAYSAQINSELFEELVKTNPDMPDEFWSELSQTKKVNLERLIEAGDIQPHLYNIGFGLNDDARTRFNGEIRHIKFSKEQISSFLTYLMPDIIS